MKKMIILLVIINFVGMIGCGVGVKEETVTNNSIERNRLEIIEEKGKITIAAPLDDISFLYIDPNTNKISGIDADIIAEAARRLGINKIEIKQFPFGDLLEKLNTDNSIDIAAGGIYITPEREKIVSFTQPLYKDSEAIIVPRFSKINFKSDLKNAIVGVEKGTIFVDLAERWKKNNLIKDIVIFPNTSELLNAVNNETINAGIADAVIVKYFLLKDKNLIIRILQDYTPELHETVGIAVRKNDTTLLNALNEKISEMKSDGALHAILVENGLDRNNMIEN